MTVPMYPCFKVTPDIYLQLECITKQVLYNMLMQTTLMTGQHLYATELLGWP